MSDREPTSDGQSAEGSTGAAESGDQETPSTAAPTTGSGSRSSSRRGDRPDLAARRRHPDGPKPASRRRRWLIGVIAAVVVIALAVGLTVYGLSRRAPQVEPSTGPTPSSSTSTEPVLTPTRMLSAAQAKLILPDTTWTVVSDQSGPSTSTSAACLSPAATQNAPNPLQILSRTLSAGGTAGPMVLHQAQAFGSTDEATVTYALMARALGNCDLANSYLVSGASIDGLGDQSTAVVIADQAKKQYRTVVVDRTGRVVNVIDVVTAQSNGGGPLDGAVTALGKVTDSQCTAALGECASLVTVKPGPPPVSGDQPGFLAVADIPQPEAGAGSWVGQTPAKPSTLVTTGCENVDFGTVDAESSGARTYLLSDKPTGMPAAFGLDEAIFTMTDEKSATDLANQITQNLESCKERQLTATVNAPTSVSGVGADGIAVQGKTYLVTQKTSDTATAAYRVGVVTAGVKVVYVFLPTEGKFDLTDAQWTALAARAGARATQVG